MGIIAPNANGLQQFEEALREGRSGIRFIPKLQELNFACQIGGVPQDFQAIRDSYFNP
jgi:3-oxoacyl-(acyl-carrier-protein) synthase